MTSECCILVNISRTSINVLNKFQVRSSLEAIDVECMVLSYFVTETNCLSVRVYISIIHLLTSVVNRGWIAINSDRIDINCVKVILAGPSDPFWLSGKGSGRMEVQSQACGSTSCESDAVQFGRQDKLHTSVADMIRCQN